MNYEYKDKTMVETLKKKDEIIKEARKISADIEKLEGERAKLGLKVEKIKGKVRSWVEKNVKLEGEFEEIEKVDVVNGVVVVTSFDMVEEFKKGIREKKKELATNSK